MKKFVLLLTFFILSLPSNSLELSGGVAFNVDSARDYIRQGMPEGVYIPQKYFWLDEENTEKIVYSYNNEKEVIGITVQYINDPLHGYIYNKNKRLIYFEKYDKPISIFPHRGYRYTPEGKLDLTSLSVSKNENYRFSPEGNLVSHTRNGIIYDEEGNIIGSAETLE